jgi:hypothetical protein
MKEKILAYLKTKIGSHAGGIQETYLNGIAETYSKTITEEDKIATELNDTVLGSIKTSYDFILSEVGRRTTEAQKTALKNFMEKHGLDESGNKIEAEPPKKKNVTKTDDLPQWFIDYQAKMEQQTIALQSKIEGYEKQKTQEQLLGKVHSKIEELGIPKDYLGKVALRGLQVNSDEEIDVVVQEIESDWKKFKQTAAEQGVSVSIPPTPKGGVTEGEAVGKAIAARRNAQVSEGVKAKKL